MKSKGKFIRVAKIFISIILVAVASYSVIIRSFECFSSNDPAALAAAAFTLTDGTYRINLSNSTDSINSTDDKQQKPTQPQTKPAENVIDKVRDKSDYYDSFASHEGENKYEITENTYGADGTAFGSAYIKNKTGLDIDFTSKLKEKLTFDVKTNAKEPQVLIYHTHTSEAYIDEDVNFFYDSFYSRTENTDFNVIAVGEAITASLESKGIKTLHDKTIHDVTYNGSYDRSAETIRNNLEKYDSIKVVLDIHRDAIGTDMQKIKPVFTHNGKKGAQIMILSGCDTNGDMGFYNWENNLSFALKIQNTAETLYPNMTRPLSFGYFAYNEYICDGSLLIEVGTEANSIDEAVYTGELLGNVLAKVLG